MKANLSIELGPQAAGHVCACCGSLSTIVHGFVYRDGDAFAIYYAGWSNQHPERGVSLAIAIGDWGEGSGPADRTSIGMEARSVDTDILFLIIEPEQSPWGETSLFGKMLPRGKAIRHPLLRHALDVAELIVYDDSRVHLTLST